MGGARVTSPPRNFIWPPRSSSSHIEKNRLFYFKKVELLWAFNFLFENILKKWFDLLNKKRKEYEKIVWRNSRCSQKLSYQIDSTGRYLLVFKVTSYSICLTFLSIDIDNFRTNLQWKRRWWMTIICPELWFPKLIPTLNSYFIIHPFTWNHKRGSNLEIDSANYGSEK